MRNKPSLYLFLALVSLLLLESNASHQARSLHRGRNRIWRRQGVVEAVDPPAGGNDVIPPAITAALPAVTVEPPAPIPQDVPTVDIDSPRPLDEDLPPIPPAAPPVAPPVENKEPSPPAEEEEPLTVTVLVTSTLGMPAPSPSPETVPPTDNVEEKTDPVVPPTDEPIDPVTPPKDEPTDPVVPPLVPPLIPPLDELLNSTDSLIPPLVPPTDELADPVIQADNSTDPVVPPVIPPINAGNDNSTDTTPDDNEDPDSDNILSDILGPINTLLPTTVLTKILEPLTSATANLDIPSISVNISLPTPSPIPTPDLPDFPTPITTPPIIPTPTDNSTVTDKPTEGTGSESIVFPTGNSTVTDSETSPPVASPTPPPTPDTSFAFLTETNSLLITSLTEAALSITDPDEPTTTIAIATETTENSPTSAPLPADVPTEIVPQTSVDENALTGYALISILFNRELNWQFVTSSQESSTQIFAFFPTVLQKALSLDAEQVKTLSLHVYIPGSYNGPADIAELGTMYLGYIPKDLVDTLAAQIKAKNSEFYTGLPGVYAELAARVDSGFDINTYPDPKSADSKLPGEVATTKEAKMRQDAIIGVVTSIGAVAVIILAVLVLRSWKRRKELAHHRLSDPPDMYIGERPAGRDFDQDSVGGQRRRSFYFAEDSLRGFQTEERQEDPFTYNHRSEGDGMRERRPIAPTAISAPILQQSSMNW